MLLTDKQTLPKTYSEVKNSHTGRLLTNVMNMHRDSPLNLLKFLAENSSPCLHTFSQKLQIPAQVVLLHRGLFTYGKRMIENLVRQDGTSRLLTNVINLVKCELIQWKPKKCLCSHK